MRGVASAISTSLLTLAVLVFAASPASAAVRSGASTVGGTTAEVSYDDQAGSVRVFVRFPGPAPNPSLSLLLRRDCERPFGPAIALDGRYYTNSAGERRGYIFGGTLEQGDGNRTLTALVARPEYVGVDLRCVTGGVSEQEGTGAQIEFYFGGYGPPPDPFAVDPTPTPTPSPVPEEPEPLVLDSRGATSHADAYLLRRFGDTYAEARSKWLKCPREEIFELEGAPSAICQFEFRDGTRYRGGGLVVRLEDEGSDDERLIVARFSTGTYTKALRSCRDLSATKRNIGGGLRLVNRRLRASGLLDCRSLPGSAGMVNDLDYLLARRFPQAFTRAEVGFHGTNRAGFEDQARFPCRVRSRATRRGRAYTFTCRNRLRDSFIYAATVQPRPRPRRPAPNPAPPEPARPRCNPNYQGVCLPLSGDVDCGDINARNFRVVGDDPFRLDADNDNIVCED